MDKNAIKKYAVWARTELIERVTQKALQYGISEKEIIDANADSINGKLLSNVEKKQRKALIEKITEDGFEQVMEEVAYTWFNRFVALRFMEVNGYLPTRVRIFTDENNDFRPQILTEALNIELEGLDIDKIYSYKDDNKTDELYKYLLIVQCNALNEILPKMFQRISDYTELLLPDNLLREGSIIQQMIEVIPEEDWKDAVQIIGWLYQYYNSTPKDIVFSNLKKNIKIKKEDIPAATQLFTPDWIVRYMVENSLGRIWYEGHHDESLKSEWKYYLDEAEQVSEIENQLSKISDKYKNIKPEEIKCIDPCMGSGHILVYMFDVLMQIYESYGYNTRDAVTSIIENNIYGLDIDDRAAQLAYFSLMMKARQYDRRFFSRHIQPHIYAITESNGIGTDIIEYFANGKENLKTAINTLVNEMKDAKEYGSIIKIPNVDFTSLYERITEIQGEVTLFKHEAIDRLLPIIKVSQVMAQKYDVVVTNPPYMGSKGMSDKLGAYVKKNYTESKSDLFAVFIDRCNELLSENGYQAMITQHSWMFLSSFKQLRLKMEFCDIINMVHLGARAFEEIGGEVVQTTSWVQRNSKVDKYKGTYCRLVEPTTQQGKEEMFLAGENRYITLQKNFSKVPGSPIAYWVSEHFISTFENTQLDDKISAVKGLDTCDNERFVRNWFEVSYHNIGFDVDTVENTYNHTWFPYCKGGGFRKWYGLLQKVVDWKNDGEVLRNIRDVNGKIKSRPQNIRYYFTEGLTFSTVTSYKLSLRYMDNCIFGGGGSGIFTNMNLYYVCAFLNSKICEYSLGILNPTLNFLVGDILSLPIIISDKYNSTIESLVQKNISLSKNDWDSYENSWDFKKHPLIPEIGITEFPNMEMSLNEAIETSLENVFNEWRDNCAMQFNQLKLNEEELNRIFINIYGLQDEISAEVEDRDITVRKANRTSDIKSLISYAVGCMFGRYSLDIEGIAYAGGDWDSSNYIRYPAVTDGIIPICDDEYFENDIVGRFIKFIEIVYGPKTLDENLKYIADSLGGKGSPNEVIRNYFINEFYTDHCKTYQKRPIYWMFDSGKKNGFKALIYIHRYQPDTIARIRTDYVHEQQARYQTAISEFEERINSVSTNERMKINKQLNKLKEQESELRNYEENIHHLADKMIPINLDDGVKINYEKIKEVLSKIK